MLIQNDWKRLVGTFSEKHMEDTLHRLMQATGWPSSEEFVPLLQNSDFASSQERMPSSYTIQRHKPERDAFWVDAVTRYKLNLGMPFPSHFPMWLVTFGNQEAFAQLIKQSAPSDVEAWLKERTEMRVLNSGYDKGSNLLLMASTDQQKVLAAISEVLPDWTSVVDKKGRTALFLANSTSMVEFLLDQGVDPDIKNTAGQTAVDFWMENKLPHAAVWSEKVNASKSDPASSVVSKLFQFKPEFTQEENVVFEEILKDPDNWSWEGRLGGLERVWSVYDIWRYAEVSMTFGLQPRPDFFPKGQVYYYSGGSDFSNITEGMHGARLAFPALSKLVDEVGRPSSMFEKAMWFCMQLQQKPSVLPVDFNTKVAGMNYNEVARKTMDVSSKQAQDFLSSMPLQDKAAFNQEMIEIVRQEWFSRSARPKMTAYLSALALPASLGGMMTDNIPQAVVEDRQHEGWRDVTIMEHFARPLYQAWTGARAFASQNPEEWKDVARVALCYAGTANSMFEKESVSGPKVQNMLVDFIQRGMPMDKVPQRWTRNFTTELKSSVMRWIIEATLEKRQKKKPKEEEVVVRKRKM